MIETSHLQTLVAVARAKSFSKAAEDLSVTQSAISQNIKSLETKVGAQLFSRNGRTVNLTDEGEKLYTVARDFLNKMENVVSEIQEEKDSMTGKIRIGTLMGLGKSWLSQRIVEFTKLNPKVVFQTKYANSEELMDMFENHELDVIIVSEHHLPQGAEKRHIFNEYLTLLFPDSKDFPIKADIDLATLASYPVILFDEKDPLFTRWCREKFGSVPKKLNKRLVINSHGTMIKAVAEGLGMAVLPTHVFKRSSSKDKVLNLGKKFEVFNNKFYFVCHKNQLDHERYAAFVDYLSKEKPLTL
ncbi:MAG: LysR family transcriptional regulator [Bacteriovoracaceae bacterium]